VKKNSGSIHLELVHYQAMSWFNNHKDKRKLAGQKGSSDVKK